VRQTTVGIASWARNRVGTNLDTLRAIRTKGKIPQQRPKYAGAGEPTAFFGCTEKMANETRIITDKAAANAAVCLHFGIKIEYKRSFYLFFDNMP
jgi:hypothetical protein